jgi:hypothetical protein
MEAHTFLVAIIRASGAATYVNAAFANPSGTKRWLTQMKIRASLRVCCRSSLKYETA